MFSVALNSILKSFNSIQTQIKQEITYLHIAEVEVVHDISHEDVLQQRHVLVVVAAVEWVSPETVQLEVITNWSKNLASNYDVKLRVKCLDSDCNKEAEGRKQI